MIADPECRIPVDEVVGAVTAGPPDERTSRGRPDRRFDEVRQFVGLGSRRDPGDYLADKMLDLGRIDRKLRLGGT